jgi:apolipoprotein D and lipocalin family protein
VKELFAFGLILLPVLALSKANDSDTKLVQVVPSVDLSRYTGKWHEIARLPNRFQKDCSGEVTATYSLLGEGQLKVVNECRKNGRIERAEGKARLAAKDGPSSKLEVRFAPSWLSWLPFVWGDYWVIELASDYSYSVVGTPDRKYLWILSRAPQMDEETYKRLIEKAKAQGFDVAKLMKTPTR